jgi:hypothetical protein
LIKPERKEVLCSVEIPTLVNDWQEGAVESCEVGQHYLEVNYFFGAVGKLI